MSTPRTASLRRAYEQVTVAPAEAGLTVLLDDKPLKSPGGRPMILPTAALAGAIAAEWSAQGVKPDLRQLPMTRIAATALDRIPAVRAEVVKELAAYAETELVCHRADEPAGLVARQLAVWQPLLDWLTQAYDAPLAATAGILPKAQPEPSLRAIRSALAALDDFRLAGVSVAVASAGSLVIGLALTTGRLDSVQAFEAAELDATYQIEQWGEDEIARQRRAELRAELEVAERFARLVRG